jgi:hypothetical protein
VLVVGPEPYAPPTLEPALPSSLPESPQAPSVGEAAATASPISKDAAVRCVLLVPRTTACPQEGQAEALAERKVSHWGQEARVP